MKYTKAAGEVSKTYEADTPEEIAALIKVTGNKEVMTEIRPMLMDELPQFIIIDGVPIPREKIHQALVLRM